MRLAADESGVRLDHAGLGLRAVAPRPWRTAPIRFERDMVRVLDARGEEIGRLRPADAALVLALVNAPCARCRGTGRVARDCDDPQCGDSTWDHACTAGSAPCPDCGGPRG